MNKLTINNLLTISFYRYKDPMYHHMPKSARKLNPSWIIIDYQVREGTILKCFSFVLNNILAEFDGILQLLRIVTAEDDIITLPMKQIVFPKFRGIEYWYTPATEDNDGIVDHHSNLFLHYQDKHDLQQPLLMWRNFSSY